MIGSQYLIDALTKLEIPDVLAKDLTKYFLKIYQDIKASDIEKSSSGKFVETIVQILQSLDPLRCDYDKSVQNVDHELNQTYNSTEIKNIPTESRVLICRISRSVYCLRSKRSIIHKNGMDPNHYDLEFIYQCCQWIMTEFLRISNGFSAEESKSIIEEIQRPVYPIIENLMGRLLVLDDSINIEEEILLILYNEYSKPEPTSRTYIGKSLDRRSSGAVTNALKRLWKKRWIEGNKNNGFKLTNPRGVLEAKDIANKIAKINGNI